MIVCPACGLKNPDSAPHCDCGRALAAGAVDRGATAHAAVRGGRGWLREGVASIRAHWLRSIATTVALGLIAYGLMRWRHGPAHRARLAVQELCGDRFKEHLDASGGGVAVAGCLVYRDGRLSAAMGSHDDGRLAFVNISVTGDLPAMPGVYAKMMSAVAPLIERDRLATIEEQLETLVPRGRGRPFDEPRDSFYAGAGTTVGEAPWRRDATLNLEFDGSSETGGQTTAWAKWLANARRRGWDTDLGEVDSQTIAAWQSFCADDTAIAALVGDRVRVRVSRQVPDWPGRWSVGDTWMRCHVALGATDDAGDLDFWTQWMGPTRRLLRVRIELKGVPGDSFAALVERVVIPLLRHASSPPNETLQAQIRQAARVGEFETKDNPVHSLHSPQYTLPPDTIYRLEVCRADCL